VFSRWGVSRASQYSPAGHTTLNKTVAWRHNVSRNNENVIYTVYNTNTLDNDDKKKQAHGCGDVWFDLFHFF